MATSVPHSATFRAGSLPTSRPPVAVTGETHPAPPSAPAASRPELGSRDDIAFERLIDELRQTLASLAISMKTCRRGSDNPVYRMSAEQQFDVGLSQLASLLALPSVPYDQEAARLLAAEAQPFLEVAKQMAWSTADSRVTALFAAHVEQLFAPDRLKKDGRPATAFEALLASRVSIPEPAPEPATQGTGNGTPASHQGPLPASEAPVVLHETVFTFGDGTHHAHVGGMYVAFVVHVRGVSLEEAKQSVSPAALMGFAQSLEKALAGHRGPVAFRIVRKGSVVEPQLNRLV